jgi:multiple sugar transport system permease protein
MGRGNGFPANSTLLYPIYLFNQAFKSPFHLGYASALAWLMFVLILVLTGINVLISRYYVNEDVE